MDRSLEFLFFLFYIDSFDRCCPGLGGGLGLIKLAGGVARGEGL